MVYNVISNISLRKIGIWLEFALPFSLDLCSFSFTNYTGCYPLPYTKQPYERGLHGKELKPPAISHMSALEANYPTLQVTAGLANNLMVASWEARNQNESGELFLDFLLSETVWDNVCLKFLSFGVMWCTSIDNEYREDQCLIMFQLLAQCDIYILINWLNKYLLKKVFFHKLLNPDSYKFSPGTFHK